MNYFLKTLNHPKLKIIRMYVCTKESENGDIFFFILFALLTDNQGMFQLPRVFIYSSSVKFDTIDFLFFVFFTCYNNSS